MSDTPPSPAGATTFNAPLARYGLPVALVCLAHAAVLAALWPSAPRAGVTAPQVLDVVLISATSPAPVPPAPPAEPVRPRAPKPKPVIREPVIKAPSPQPQPQPVAAPVAAPAPFALAAAPLAAPAPVIVPPRVDASYRGNPKPPYPRASRRRREEGTVLLRIFVNADGTVGEVVLLKSSGFSRLDQSAMTTVQGWKLIPARRGNEPFAAWYQLVVPFSITPEK